MGNSYSDDRTNLDNFRPMHGGGRRSLHRPPMAPIYPAAYYATPVYMRSIASDPAFIPDTIVNAKFTESADGRKVLNGISRSSQMPITTTAITYWDDEKKLVHTVNGLTYYYVE